MIATLDALRRKLYHATVALAASVAANQSLKTDSPATSSERETSMDPLAGLTTQVNSTVGVMASAKVLIDGFAAKLAAAGTDPVKLQALQDSLKTNSDALAASVANNP